MKITYLFTTFPLLSERFLQREIEAMRELGVELEIFSLYRGEAEFQGLPVYRFRWWHWIKLPIAIVRESWGNPVSFRDLGKEFLRRRPPEALNFLENLAGFAFAVIWAPHFRGSERHHIHAAWATAPATAAIWLKRLTGVRFSMGAHAYDVFRNGGDWILERKLQEARLIHTSTEATQSELLRRGADPDRVVMIRRGLNSFPEMKPARPERGRGAIRLLTVGRFIEKKGLDDLLRICAALREEGILFEYIIIGEGPLRKSLLRLRDSLGLADVVRLVGAQPYERVSEFYRWADLFCFTGRVASSNDRDGLPNVIAEAMAHGVPVLSSPVSGTVEAIEDGITGYLIQANDAKTWIHRIRQLHDDDDLYEKLRMEARNWVEQNFDARKNAGRLREAFALGLAG